MDWSQGENMTKSYRDTFKGTSRYYASYRNPYPDAFFDMVKQKFKLSRNDRVLDLGCGTGQIAIPISQSVKEVAALDPEPEMLSEGKLRAEKSAMTNISWVNAGSEDLADLSSELGKFQLVTIGTAFHWMEQEKTLNSLYNLVIDGGGVAVVDLNTTLLKNPIVIQVIKKWLGEERRAGSGVFKPPAKKKYQNIMNESRFHGIEVWDYPFTFDYDIYSIVGMLYSTSYCNQNVLGDKKEAFEKDLRETLLNSYPSGQILSDGHVGAVMGWR
jgi:ubiquinone/menaquinone biosynthesis C-methylase UbiE